MQTIMIIEDDPVIREEMSFLLENENYQALPVSDFETIPGQAERTCSGMVSKSDTGKA